MIRSRKTSAIDHYRGDLVTEGLSPQVRDVATLPKVILHIGIHKTGTSSIQRFLESAEAQLLEAGCLYPQTCRMGNSHSLLAWSATERYRKKRFPVPPVEIVIRELLDELNTSTFEKVLLSSEFFWPMTGAEVSGLRAHLAGFDVRAVIYVRNFLEFLKSGYGQGIKAGTVQPLDTKYLREHLWRYDLDTVLNAWKVGLGSDKVTIRIYDKVKDRLIDDFLQACDLQIESTAVPAGRDINVTPADAILRAHRLLNLLERKCHVPSLLFRRVKRRWQDGRAGRLEQLAARLCFKASPLLTPPIVDEFRELTSDFQWRFLHNHIPEEDHHYFFF